MLKDELKIRKLQLEYLIGLRIEISRDVKRFLKALDGLIDDNLEKLYEVLDNAQIQRPSVP